MHRFNAGPAVSRRAVISAGIACAAGMALSACGVGDIEDGGAQGVSESTGSSALAKLSWADLAELARDLANAGDDEARGIAAEQGLLTSDGSLDIMQEKPFALADGTRTAVRVAGLRADEAADGSGTVGITLAFVEPIARRGMNRLDSARGGWAASDLRSWLSDRGLSLLPRELAQAVRPVVKRTARTADDAAEEAAETLWLFSESELGGGAYLNDRYPADAGARDEGSTYELFERGLGGGDALDAAFIRPSGGTGAWNCWWQRTVDPTGRGFLFRTYNGTHDTGIGYSPSFELGVCPGLCL